MGKQNVQAKKFYLESLRSEGMSEDEFEFVCLVIVRIRRSAHWHRWEARLRKGRLQENENEDGLCSFNSSKIIKTSSSTRVSSKHRIIAATTRIFSHGKHLKVAFNLKCRYHKEENKLPDLSPTNSVHVYFHVLGSEAMVSIKDPVYRGKFW